MSNVLGRVFGQNYADKSQGEQLNVSLWFKLKQQNVPRKASWMIYGMQWNEQQWISHNALWSLSQL